MQSTVPPMGWLLEHRPIETVYGTYLTTQNTAEIAETTRKLLELQTREAHLRLAGPQFSASELTAPIEEMAATLSAELGGLAGAVDHNNHLTEQGNKILAMGFDLLHGDIQEQIDIARMQLEGIRAIGERLASPEETLFREVRRQGSESLRRAAAQSGAFRDRSLGSAYDSFRSAVSNEVGKNDWTSWFNVGFLAWKSKRDPAEAEFAFSEAWRLHPDKDGGYVSCIRHVAYMQYLQGRFEDAYQTMGDALSASREHDVLFDQARYAARTGRVGEAVELLRQCVEQRPATLVTMFSEEDLTAHMPSELARFAADVWKAMEERVKAKMAALRETAEKARKVEGVLSRRPATRCLSDAARVEGKVRDLLEACDAQLGTLDRILRNSDYCAAVAWLRANDDSADALARGVAGAGRTYTSDVGERRKGLMEQMRGEAGKSASALSWASGKLAEERDVIEGRGPGQSLASRIARIAAATLVVGIPLAELLGFMIATPFVDGARSIDETHHRMAQVARVSAVVAVIAAPITLSLLSWAEARGLVRNARLRAASTETKIHREQEKKAGLDSEIALLEDEMESLESPFLAELDAAIGAL